jgi:beta-glucuronidase
VLDGEWQFGFAENVDPLTASPSVKTPAIVTVPHSFDVAPPGVLGRRGTAFYRTSFAVSSPQSPLLLYFTACSFYCRVFLDNKFIGEHRAGGYQPFWLPPQSDGTSTTREIFVVVDNRFNHTLAPTHTGGDFYFYGGITRSVVVHELRGLDFIQQIETFTKDYREGKIDIRIVLAGHAAQQTSASFYLSYDGAPRSKVTVPVEKDGVAWIKDASVPFAEPWNLDSPNLHVLNVTLLNSNEEVDAIEVRFGIRIVSTKEEHGVPRIAINDKVVKLHGVNRHTMWPDTGAALTLDQILVDVSLLLELGANYVRGAHYPQDPRFLDLCDEVGIVVWEETLGPGVSLKDIQDPYFMKYQIQSVNEMIDASINHPSVILHGFFNEGPSSSEDACIGYQAMASAVRSRVGSPPSRLVTWASDKRTQDVCLKFADIISFNAYPAWYIEPGNVTYVVPFWTSQISWVTAKFPKKAFTISETGAGGVFEWRNHTAVFWSQEFMSEVVGSEAKFGVSFPYVSGITLWQFTDIKGNDDAQRKCGQCEYAPHPPSLSVPWDCAYISVKCGRPGGENHKGQVDFWRRKKDSFHKVQEHYRRGKLE